MCLVRTETVPSLTTEEFVLLYSVHVRTRKPASEATLMSAGFRRCGFFGFSRGQSIVLILQYRIRTILLRLDYSGRSCGSHRSASRPGAVPAAGRVVLQPAGA